LSAKLRRRLLRPPYRALKRVAGTLDLRLAQWPCDLARL